MKKLIAFLFILLVISPLDVHASSNTVSRDKELIAESGGRSVRVVVSSFPGSQECKAASSWRWGAENSCPRTFVVALDVKTADTSSFIPLSAFADLGQPRNVRIESRKGKGRFAVVLTGGDAATSYTATLEFRDNRLTERVVRHGEFPSQSWEKTLYKFNMNTIPGTSY